MTSLTGTSSAVPFEALSTAQRTGAIVVAAFSSLSTLALAFIALRSVRLATAVLFQRDDSAFRSPQILFFRTQLGHYSGCLLLSNLFISSAGLIDFSWASQFGLSQGPICEAQAVLSQIGIWGTCYFTTALSVHTLSSFVFRTRRARWRSAVFATIGWTVALVAGLVPMLNGNIFGPIGLSCGITHFSSVAKIALEALPVILTVFMSTVVYLAIFIVLYGKLSMNGKQRPRVTNTDRRREDRLEDCDEIVSKIIWSVFWFPLAFALLSLPFCITRIVMYAGYSIPFAVIVFADVCISVLGFVNVCLLFNTFRVIGPVYCAPRSSSTVKTFGNDASGESPIVPPDRVFAHPTNWPDKDSHQLHNPAWASSGHSRDSSWASTCSNTELLGAEKETYHSVQTKAVPLVSSGTIPPPSFGRQLDGGVPSRSATRDPPLSRVPSVKRDTPPEPSDNWKGRSFHPMEDIKPSRNGAKEPTFKSKAPSALNLSHFPDLPNPFPPQEVTSKSSTLATRLGISAAAIGNPAQVPRIEINRWTSDRANESDSRLALPSPSSSDSESVYSGETARVCTVRPLPGIPELEDDEENVVDTRAPSPQTMHMSERATTASIWSQDTGYTLNPPHMATLEMYPQPIANLIIPGVVSNRYPRTTFPPNFNIV